MKDFIKDLKKAWPYTKNSKKELTICLITHIIAIIFGIIVPIISAKIIIALTSNNYYQIILISIVLFFIESIYDIIDLAERTTMEKIYRESFSNIQIDLGKEILKLENQALDDNGSGVFIQRINNDTSKLADIFNSMIQHITEIVKNIGIFIAIFIISRPCFFYLLLVTIITFLLDKKRTTIRKENTEKIKEKEELATSFVNEMVRGARDIKMLNAENGFTNSLKRKIRDANDERYNMRKIDRLWLYFSYEIRDFTSLLLTIILVILIINKSLNAALALVIYNYSFNTSYVTISISNLLDAISDFTVSANRVFSIIENKEFKKEKFGKTHIDVVKGDFEFKNVTFAYKEDTPKVLNNLSFKIKSKQTVAFVGKSGAGKSTIFSLLCKMYNDYKGTITIDNIDINELDKDSIRGNITIISQDPYIFNVSIKDNLKLVKEDVTDEEIYEACRLACLDEFINSLKDKYDTVVGEGGVTLSGGQKQRLAIARALVQKTEIILFDEATSALDNETQEHIQKAIENMKNKYTILIIAHRLSTIINSDKILFLNNGKIEASGTHKELLKKSKEYKTLYESEIEK